MKNLTLTSILGLILFFDINIFAQTNWYVSNITKGNGNGLSWENARAAGYGVSGAFNWSTLQPGDTVFFDGGSDSLVYSGAIRAVNTHGTAGNPIVLTKGRDAGHNGAVWIPTMTSPIIYAITIGAGGYPSSNILVDGLNGFVEGNAGLVALYEATNITVKNGTFYASNGSASLIGAGMTTNFHLLNNYFEVLTKNINTWYDGMYMSGGSGGHIFDGNTFILRGSEPTAHRDCFQIGYLEGGTTQTNRPSIRISNNFIWAGDEDNVSMNCAIYGYSSGSLSWLIYNNVIHWVGSGARIIDIGRDMYTNGTTANMRASVRMFNNTMYNYSSVSSQSMWFEGQRDNGIGRGSFCDTVIYKNNILYDNSGGNAVFVLGSGADYDSIYKDFNYNRYYFPNMGSNPSRFLTANSGQDFSFTGWQTEGEDASSSVASISFTNLGSVYIADYFTATGRDLGTDLTPLFTTDILGNERTGAWDIGALEYQGSQSNNINLKSKIFLQGPFSTNSMMTNLSQNGLLPTTQPFNSAPWNYNGNDTLGSDSTSSYVDWVLVELRSSSSPTQVISRRAAILNNNGLLLDTDGSQGVRFNNVPEGAYYIAVFQRNHLAVMSANPVQLSSNSPLYDFTNAMNKAYGTEPMIDLGNGRFGMYAGDGNGDNGINFNDRAEVWQLQNGTMGYLKGDFNLDGGVNIIDANIYWSPNTGRVAQLPENE
ncbi:MAG: hypothetical protein KGZ85_08900 [Ignavibacterium sp.]|nr:hypothetical protein [Ignavibacterium sp.]